jgi:hypothetical protein
LCPTLPLRYDPGNERLVADLSEVRAACPQTTGAAATPSAAADAAEGDAPGEHGSGGGEAATRQGAATTAAVWERAAERFRVRDYEGAAQAFGVALEMQVGAMCWP